MAYFHLIISLLNQLLLHLFIPCSDMICSINLLDVVFRIKFYELNLSNSLVDELDRSLYLELSLWRMSMGREVCLSNCMQQQLKVIKYTLESYIIYGLLSFAEQQPKVKKDGLLHFLSLCLQFKSLIHLFLGLLYQVHYLIYY